MYAISKGNRPEPWILINACVLGACLLFLETPASLSASQGCAKAPTSSFVVNVKDKGAKAGSRTLRSQLRAHIPARGKNTPARLEVSRVTTSAFSAKLALRDDGLA